MRQSLSSGFRTNHKWSHSSLTAVLWIIGTMVVGGAVVVGAAVLTGSSSLTGVSSALGYRPVPACVVVDSRLAGAGVPFVAPAARAYDVTPENGNFSAQGGSATGCGVPEGAAAVFLNLKTEHVSGVGRVEVYAHGTPQTGAPIVNFDPSSFKDNAGATTGLCRGDSCGADFVVNVPGQTGASTHVIITVLGYFDNISDRTVVVDGGASHTANGQALLDAVAAVAAMSPSAADPWLIKLEPGTYDLGATITGVSLPGHVHLEGSGRSATTITCDCSTATVLTSANGTSTTVTNTNITNTNSSGHGVFNNALGAKVELVGSSVSASGGFGLLNFGAATLRDTHVAANGTAATATGISNGAPSAELEVVGSKITSAGGDGISNVGGATVRDSHIAATSSSSDADGITNGTPTGGLWVIGSTVTSAGGDGIENSGTATLNHVTLDAPDAYRANGGSTNTCVATATLNPSVSFTASGCP